MAFDESLSTVFLVPNTPPKQASAYPEDISRHGPVQPPVSPARQDLADRPRRVARLNQSLIARTERQVIAAILPRIPERVMPLHLTLIGLAGAIGTAASLILCNWWSIGVAFVPVGLFIHWFGDSFDGSLARYRGTERHSSGFLIDHAVDLLAMSIILTGFGLSPFLTPISALLVLAVYLLYSCYTYIRVAIEDVHRMSYGGMGATEFRLLMAGWAVGVSLLDASFKPQHADGLALIDICISIGAAAAFVVLTQIVWRDAVRIGRVEAEGERATGPS